MQRDGTLSLSDLQRDDGGLYTCTATNRYGHDSAVYHLTVLGKLHSLQGVTNVGTWKKFDATFLRNVKGFSLKECRNLIYRKRIDTFFFHGLYSSLDLTVPPSPPSLHVIETTTSSVRVQWNVEDTGGATLQGSSLHYRSVREIQDDAWSKSSRFSIFVRCISISVVPKLTILALILVVVSYENIWV